MTETANVSTVLLISAAVVAAIRMTSYYDQRLSQEMSKLIPLVLLSTFIIYPQFFSVERVLTQLSEIGSLFNEVLYYLLFIIILEIILRFFDLLFSLLFSDNNEEEEN